MSKALLYDATLCIGCKACEDACATEHSLPYDANLAAQETTSAYKLTAIVTRGDAYIRRLCMNCQDPTCASVCPVGALAKSELGPVTYDESKCMGCRYCMVACPFNVPKYEWNKLLPRVRKCDMCSTRVAAGKPTACAEICPTGATKFGERDELLAEARERIKNGNGQYVDHIYGMSEVGGTSVFMLSAVPFETFGYHTPQEPLPDLTYRVLSRIPDLVTLGGVALGGIYWITKRRAEVAAAEGHLAKAKGKKEGERHDE
jgi:formate dehydrogenase iron-sulfur subunit